ncbi:allophanate hydrolase [uncultured Endozoicomonas sp.]|uniref:allophanate hydrolase n=1 Tax=uncultured Endozoicomonas sp. TaxID=432652 RepID=UPI0026144152|nr:allophanate hydrolase [uncultured Endozoicomonas sp.]
MWNLQLTSLRQAYETEELTPRDLLPKLRAQAIEQKAFNAWITVLSDIELDAYLSKLEQQDIKDLPLYGVPFAIKDNIDLAGVPTSAGCTAFTYTPEEHAPVVAQLIAAGAVPLGKTNLDQFATGLVGTRSPFGEGKNAFNPEYISGGSSAGSAIATALGQVSFALGTDTAGSGRVPAVLNNLTGHKPTKGLLSTRGVVPACKTLDCVSIFTLCAEDAAAVIDVAVDYDGQDSFARKNAFANRARYFSNDDLPQGFTFGVPDELDFQGNQETAALFQKAVVALEKLGGRPVTIDFAPFLETATLLYDGPWVAERWLATKNVAADDMLPVIKGIIGQGNKGSSADVFSAQYHLAELKRRCDHQIVGLDFVITPTTPTLFTRDEVRENPVRNNSILGTYTNFMNLLDYCATAVTVGFTESGVPWGVSLFNKAFTDIQLLGFASRLERVVNLPQGATSYAKPTSVVSGAPASAEVIDVVVCGAHLEGQPLNWQLTDRGGVLKSKTKSSACYRLYALPDGKRPGMARDESNGGAIEVEVWSLPADTFGSFVNGIPAPLGIGKVELMDGSWVSGFICDGYGLQGALDITDYGSWCVWLSK